MKEDKKGSDDEIFHTLLKPFTYSLKGESRKAEFLTVRSPTSDNLSSVAQLKQGFMKAVTGSHDSKAVEAARAEGKAKEASLDNLTGDAIIAMLSMSDINYAVYLETAKFVFTHSDVCLIDGEIEFNKELSRKLSFDDLEALTGEYLRVFILTSVLKTMQT